MRNKIYIQLSAVFFFFFVSWSACYSLFAIWLSQELGLNGQATGIIFSINALFSLLMQPLYGFISDKIGVRKLLLMGVSSLLVLTGPFFIYVYQPLLQYNVTIGAIVGGLFLGTGFLASVGMIESYVEKISRKYQFEYGRSRMWGSLGWAAATFFSGRLFNINPNLNFWMSSVAAIIMVLIVFSLKIEVNESDIKEAESVSLKDVMNLFKLKDFWAFILFTIGVACVYGVYDQQFPTYFAQQFSSVAEGNQMFGYLNSFQVFLEAGMMFIAPTIVNKLGARKALLFASFLMAGRIIGSGLVSGPVFISFMKLIHALELPILLVAVFKYLEQNFEKRLSSILYLVGYQFSMQVGTILLSSQVGSFYDHLGFKQTYFFLGMIVLTFTIISVFTLKKEQVSPVLKPIS